MTTLDLYETDAASRRNPTMLAGLRRLWASYNRKRAERRMLITLSGFDDRTLHDIGIDPRDVSAALRGQAAPSILFNPMRRDLGDD